MPYESNMQPHTPRCGLEKTSILTDGCQKVNSIFQITNEQFKSRRQERSRTSIYNVVLTITPPTEILRLSQAAGQNNVQFQTI